MTTNLLNNLSNVLKKGPSETQKNPLSCEEQSAAEKSNRVLITCLSRVNHLIQYRCMRYAALLLVLLLAGIGNAWGASETLTWDGKALAGSGGTNTSAGTASLVAGSSRKVSSVSISSSKIEVASQKYDDGYWEDFTCAGCTISTTTNATSTARIEFPITINAGYDFTVSGVGFKLENGGGSGPRVHVFMVQGATSTWLGYSDAATVAWTPSSLTLSAGSAKLVFVLGVASNKNNGRGFKFSGISITGTSAAAGSSHNVSAETSTGTNTYGSVSAASSTVVEGGTTTITATPAEGYRVTNWAVSGTGASISPSGASNSNTTTLTMGTADATVTVTFGAIPSHTISYTNTKGMDNSANPTSYYEGVGVASFTKLRHAVGYDFTGWSPSSISSSATTNQTIDAQWSANAVATGTGTLTYALGYSDNTITTSSITRNNGALYDATDLTWTGVTIDESESNERSGKITTTDDYNSGKYLSLTFKIADGYTFTPTEVQLKAVAVSNDKTIRFEFTDNAGTPNSKYLEQVRANGSSVGTLTYDFDASDPVTLTGTVTVKIYAYGKDNSWRLGTPITITGTVASAAVCPSAYSFHYGPTTGDWETPICFEKVGDTHEWRIENFTIPSHSGGKFWVGYAGSTNSQSATKAWTDSYSDGNGAMKLLPTSSSIVGQATGAKGTIRIWDNSGWQNQDVGFIPDGYGITYGGASYAFSTTATDHMLETNVVTLPDVSSTTYTMGLATATAGTYVTCAHSSAAENINAMGVTIIEGGKKKILLIPGSFNAASAKYAVYDVTNEVFDTDFMTDADGDGVYEGFVGSNCTTMILCRMNSDATTSDLSSKNWDKRWNQTDNIGIGDLLMKYEITNMDTWNKCAYTTTVMHPATGEKGKFRMWDDSGSSNWYVHWIPYYVLSYDANGGTESTAAQERNSESSTLTVNTRSNGFTAPTGYEFAGWATDESRADAGTVDYAAGASYTLTASATLYAVWRPATYTITLAKGDHGAANQSATVAYNATAVTTFTAVTANTGYTCSGYYDGSTQVLDAAGVFAGSSVTGFITDSKWSKADNCTLTAKWTAKQTTITINANTANHGSTTPGTVTATYASALPSFTAASGASGYSLTGYYTDATSGTKVINADGTLVRNTTYATDESTPKWKYETATLTLYAQYEEEVSCTGDPTALVSGTLYQVSDMASACLGEIISTGQYFYGLSSNGKFYINGTTNSNNASTGTVEIKTASNTIDKIEFTGIAWFKGAGTNTCRSIKFVVPSAGTLTIYGKTSSSKGNVVIKTESSGNTTVIANSVNAYASGSTTVSAGTYYVLSDGESAAIVGLKFVESACSAPAAPTISGTTSYTAGQTITLTASHDGSNHDGSTTYTWYKGADWATARAASPVQAAATGSSGYTFTKASCVVGDAGTYWCEAANSTCTSHNSSGYAITVNCPSIGTPSTPTVEDLNATEAKFSWDKNGMVSGATGYQVSIIVTSSSEEIVSWTSSGISTEDGGYVYTATGLTEGVGYTFKVRGWSNGCVGSESSVDFTPTTSITYTVTFNSNGGSAVSPITQASEDASIAKPSDPTRASYEFDGWYATAGEKISWPYTPTADITLYARWEEECDAGGVAKSTTDVAATGYTTYQEVGGSNVAFTSAPSLGFKYKDAAGEAIDGSTTEKTHNNAYQCEIKGSGTNIGSVKTTNPYSNVDSISFYFAGSNKANCKVAVWCSTDNFSTDSTGLLSATAIANDVGANQFVRKVIAIPSGMKASALRFKFRFTVSSTGQKCYIDSLKVYSSTSGGGTCYHVYYHGNGAESGFVSDTTSYSDGAKATVLSYNDSRYPLTKEGYDFQGWATSAGGSAAYSDGQKITIDGADVHLYAKWATASLALVNWTMGTNTSTWSATATSTTDGTNIGSIATARTAGSDGKREGATAKVTMATAEVTGSAAPSNSANFTFTIKSSTKQVEISKFDCKVFNVNSGSRTYKAQISDAAGNVYNSTNTVAVSAEASLTDASFVFGSGKILRGDVTIRIYAWGSGSEFRMGPDVKFYGTVEDYACATPSAPTISGVSEYVPGQTITLTASHDGENYDNLTTYTWYEGDTWGSKSKVQNAATGSAGYTFTKASCTAGDAGKYWCEVSNGTGCDAHNSEGYDVTVYPTYTITYNLNGGAWGEVEHKDSYTQFDEDYTLPTPTKTGSVFAGWYGASDFSGLPTVVLGAGSVGNKEYWAKWGETVTVSWTVTKVDDELYRGGGGYSVKAVINETDWSTGFMDELELTATEGVTLKNIEVSENGESKVQVTADFDITTDLAADATSITFTLNVPADGKYGPKVDEHDEDLTSCAGSSTVWNFAYASDDRPTLTNSNASTEGNKNTLSATTGSGNLYYFAGSSDAFETDKYLKMNGASSGGSVNSRSVYQNRCFYIDITSNGTLTIQQYADNGNGAPKYVVANTRPLQSDYPSSSVAPTTTGGATYEINVTNYSSGTADRIWVAYPTAKAYIISVTWTPIGGGGTVTPTLTWDDGDADIANDGVSKSTSNDDFVYTARQDKNSLGAITYSSSDATVATVNATTGQVHLVGAAGTATITATIAASGCFSSANVSYTITVTDDCDDEAGTIETEDLGCSGVKMTVRGHTTTGETVSYQWYKVGTPSDATVGTDQDNFTVTEAGSYYVIVTNTGDRHCAKRSTNTITVEAQAAATVTKIVDSWYVKNGRRTPDIELVKTTNATGFTVTSGSSTIWESAGSTKTGFGGCGFHMDENGIIYLNGTKDGGAATTGLTAGDETLTITAIGCGGNASQNIIIHKQAATNYKEIAFVADGGKGMRKDSITVGHGDGTELYEYLDSVGTAAENRLFKLSERNIYWTTDEKTIREEYSQFDAILITDDPSTNTVVKKGDDYKTKGYVNAFGTMVDVRPIFTMEAYVSALKNWGSKGIAGNPESPNPRQYEMRLECKDHEIYGAGLPDPEDGTNVWEEVIDGETFRHVILVDSTKGVYKGVAYNAETKGNEKPALQGFTGEAAGSLLGLGRILEGTLQAAIERQEEPAARLLVMGINAKALQPTCALTDEGKTVIKNILVYLLKTNMEEVDDCSNYFTGENSSDWNNASNWSKNQLPSSEAKVRILAPCVISGIQPHVAQVAIVSSGKSSIRETATGSANCNGSLTINANGALIVEGEVLAADAPHFAHNDLKPTTVNDLIINTNGSGQAALIFDNEEAKTKATVNLYSLGRKDGSYLYQYFAIPMEYLTVSPTFANETHGGTKILTYAYTEAGGWERRGYYADLYAFEGLGITTNTSADHMSYQMKGTLASTATKEINMTNTTRDGFNLIGNSWSAPIQINKLSEDNSSDDIIQTAYVYCTGNDDGTGAVNPTDGAEATGQWIAIPFATSGESTWRESKLSVIPAMQAFQIKVDAAATLTLDYKKVVRGSTNSLNEKLRAPKRTNAHSDVPMSIIRVKDSKTYTDVCLLEGEIFSDEFDNGWEAEYMAGDGPSATLYAETEIGHMAVAAMPEIEGTVLGFAPGKEREYTFTFLGADMGYYLNDIKLQQSTQINAENSYTFTFEEGDTNRFYISKTPIDAGDTPTGVSNTDATPKAQKFIYQDKLYILRNGVLYDATGKHINSK